MHTAYHLENTILVKIIGSKTYTSSIQFLSCLCFRTQDFMTVKKAHKVNKLGMSTVTTMYIVIMLSCYKTINGLGWLNDDIKTIVMLKDLYSRMISPTCLPAQPVQVHDD